MDSLIVYSTNWEVLYTFGKGHNSEFLKAISNLGLTLEDSMRGELHILKENWVYFKSFSDNSVLLVNTKPMENSNRLVMETLLSDATQLYYAALCFLIGQDELNYRYSYETQITTLELENSKSLIWECMEDRYLLISSKTLQNCTALQIFTDFLRSAGIECWCLYHDNSKLVSSDIWNGLGNSTQMFLYKMRYAGFLRDIPVFVNNSPTRYISLQLTSKFTLTFLIGPSFDLLNFVKSLTDKLDIIETLQTFEQNERDIIASLPSEVLTFIAYHNTRLISKIYNPNSKEHSILTSHIQAVQDFLRDGIHYGRLRQMLVFCISNDEIKIYIGFDKNTPLKSAKQITIEIFNYFQANF
jgi:hypothetical protein